MLYWSTSQPVNQSTSQPVSQSIVIESERRCSPYSRNEYSYPQSIELRIIAENLDGQILSPYTGELFADRSQTDIEHIVATSEAHDSGLCAESASVKRQFANDLDNLTLASPSLNRHQKSSKDLAEWLPAQNICWFVQTVVEVKAKYGLSMDRLEADRALQILNDDCRPRAECQLPNPAEALNCYAGHTSADAGNATASGTSSACFQNESAYVNGTISVRSGAGVNFAKVGVIQAATVSVIESKQGGDYCWLKIGASRWIGKTHFVLESDPLSASATPTATTAPVDKAEGCYSEDNAYVNGTINVRNGAGVNFAKVGVVQTATVIVSESTQQGDYCWLRIGANRWIGKTDFVLESNPSLALATATATTARRARTESCYSSASAYVNGSINVRSGAGPNFALVGVRQHELVSVLDSALKSDYCWLQIGANRWIARLNHILAEKPETTVSTVVTQPISQPANQPVIQPTAPQPPAPSVYYKNCSAVRAANAAPIYRGQPGYGSHLDRDGDGVACE